MIRWLQIATNLFPVWTLLGAVLALFQPQWFTWFSGPWIVYGLAIIMLGMGMTLSWRDFQRVLTMPRAVFIGFALQFSIMPFLGWSLAHLFKLEPSLAVGLILVSCCPGGTASNVVAYLARANVALSVLMTMCSTFGAILLTPLLTKWLAGTIVPVDAYGLFLSTLKVVLVPVVLGLLLHQGFPKTVKTLLPVSPLISVIVIVLICSSVIGSRVETVKSSAGKLLLAVFCLHAGGFLIGYLLAKALKMNELDSRTVSIEVGMQNSGLGTVLAEKHFPDAPLTPVPCAISATFHSIIGSILAGIWRLSSSRNTPSQTSDVSATDSASSLK